MALRISKLAARDLDDIYVQGAVIFGTRQAEHYSDALDACIELLAMHPAMAPERTEISKPVRVHPHGSHLIIYEIKNEDVVILRVLHQRSDWQHSM